MSRYGGEARALYECARISPVPVPVPVAARRAAKRGTELCGSSVAALADSDQSHPVRPNATAATETLLRHF